MSVSTAAHLFTRVYELLCDGDGTARTLASAERFVRRHTSMRDRSVLAVRSAKTPMVDVFVLAMDADFGAADELTNDHMYRLTLAVQRHYHLTYESDPAVVEALQVRVLNDYAKTRAVLCHPSNLVQTEAGNDTGIGGSGFAPRGSKIQRAEPIGSGADRLVVMLDTYEAEFSFNPDA